MSYLKREVIIFGTKDLAELAYFYLQNDPEYIDHYKVIGFCVEKEYLTEDKFLGLPIYSWEGIQRFNNGKLRLFAPIANNKLRERIFNEGKEKGFKFISYISSKSNILSVGWDYKTIPYSNIGENCFILEGNNIQPFTKIGNNVIMWSFNHLGHGSVIQDNVFLTSHVVVSGHCTIKKGAYLGVNSTLRDGITIGENSIVGMGSVVTKSVPDNETWIGSPAKKFEK